MLSVRRTTLGAVAILIAVISLVASTAGSAQARENISGVPELDVTVKETAAGVVLTMKSEYPDLKLTVALEDGGVDLVVKKHEEDVAVEVIYTDEGVTLTAICSDGYWTATLEVYATPDIVMWARHAPDYNGESNYP